MTSHTANPSPMVLTNSGGADMTSRTANPSPMVYARIAGVLYLLIAALSGFVHFYVRGELIVPEMPQQPPIILWLLPIPTPLMQP